MITMLAAIAVMIFVRSALTPLPLPMTRTGVQGCCRLRLPTTSTYFSILAAHGAFPESSIGLVRNVPIAVFETHFVNEKVATNQSRFLSLSTMPSCPQ